MVAGSDGPGVAGRQSHRRSEHAAHRRGRPRTALAHGGRGEIPEIVLFHVTSPSNGDFGIWALDEYSNWANDGGGDFAFSDNGSVGTWDDSADFGDLAFKADFSAPASNGVPDVAGTAILFALGLASLTLLGRRQAALVRV